jgi:hypothetical protein
MRTNCIPTGVGGLYLSSSSSPEGATNVAALNRGLERMEHGTVVRRVHEKGLASDK